MDVRNEHKRRVNTSRGDRQRRETVLPLLTSNWRLSEIIQERPTDRERRREEGQQGSMCPLCLIRFLFAPPAVVHIQTRTGTGQIVSLHLHPLPQLFSTVLSPFLSPSSISSRLFPFTCLCSRRLLLSSFINVFDRYFNPKHL